MSHPLSKINFILILMLAAGSTAFGQTNVFKTEKGSISFRSDAPLEIITASSTELDGVIDHEAMTFAFVVPISSFKGFNNGLQQQHFYENYLEATKYPEATFTGKIIEDVDLTQPGTYNVRAKGQLTIHGRTQERIIKTELISTGTEIIAKTQFLVPLVDHQILIPKVVNQKIAQEIKVNVKATMALAGRS
jgi:polyisoprenoid-binding protein YceI